MSTRSESVLQDARCVKHTRIGIWDLYEERQPHSLRILGSSISETCIWMLQNMPYVVRMSKDMYKMFYSSIRIPNSGTLRRLYIRYLSLVETAMERRTVDTSVLADVAVAQLACTITMRLLKYARRCIIFPMDTSIRRVDAERKIHSLLYLDVPTYNALTQIIPSSRLGIQCEIVEISTNIAMTVVRLLSQLLVLMTVLREQQDGLLLAILSLSQPIFNWDGTRKAAARSSNFLRTRDLMQLVLNPQYREELVTGSMSEYITAYCLSVISILRETMHMLPVLGIDLGVDEADHVNQILFPLHVVQEPMTAFLSRRDIHSYTHQIEAGQLCVIVGVNDSGKSTILKWIPRVYDPTDGTILIDDRDIKTLKLADLQAAMSILFQGYSHFPVTNIGLGNPAFAHDDEKVREAARLGGAEEFIDDLPDGFDTYINRPLQDYHSDIEGIRRRNESLVDFSLARRVGNIRATPYIGLSGGQMQRLAVSLRAPAKVEGQQDPDILPPRFGKLTRHADLILYMDEPLQEQGTHDELMRKGGEYARIWNLQMMDFL
ncbi:P-loop containing nucleoside triphosphate hydrolase protein [Suillus hirtellus]|nr:P-loop containing nucleoside triphosphate hydrolase protein [Suillus hirtellus]